MSPMNCPYCASPDTSLLARTTSLGYSRFSCQHCARTFNERTGTPFNFLEVPTDIMFQVVLWRLRYKLSLRDLEHCSYNSSLSSVAHNSRSLAIADSGQSGQPVRAWLYCPDRDTAHRR
jgi:transposase-like protein